MILVPCITNITFMFTHEFKILYIHLYQTEPNRVKQKVFYVYNIKQKGAHRAK